MRIFLELSPANVRGTKKLWNKDFIICVFLAYFAH